MNKTSLISGTIKGIQIVDLGLNQTGIKNSSNDGYNDAIGLKSKNLKTVKPIDVVNAIVSIISSIYITWTFSREQPQSLKTARSSFLSPRIK